MIHKPHVDWFALSPVLAMTGAAGLLMLVAVFAPKSSRRAISAIVCAAGFATAVGLAVALYQRSSSGAAIIADAIFRDRWAALAEIIGKDWRRHSSSAVEVSP